MENSSNTIMGRIKPLWLVLTSGIFISFSGGALTLWYFWSIGGVPIGQTASAGAMAKVVLSTAALLAVAFFTVWLVPTIASFLFADGQSFTATLQHLFSKENPPPEPTKRTYIEPTYRRSSHSNFQEQLPVIPIFPKIPRNPISIGKITQFSLLTIGFSCFSLISYTILFSYANEKWNSYISWIIFFAWTITTYIFLNILWRRFNEYTTSRQRGEKTNRSNKIGWLLFGFFSSIVSLMPFLTLLLLFLKSDILLESDSILALILGATGISLCIVFSYATSLWMLLESNQNKREKFVIGILLNAGVLGMMIFLLGLSSRMLEMVMVLSSVRVENAIVTLESEGCELLESMNANGWGYMTKNRKICVLADITIQSTLEPSMQIACWRGTIPKQQTTDIKTPATNSSTASSANIGAPQSNLLTAGTSETIIVTGERGAFSMPVKYVRSIWKTKGIKTSNREAVCDSHFEYEQPTQSKK